VIQRTGKLQPSLPDVFALLLLQLDGYRPIIGSGFRWDRWAAPKKDGAFDGNAALIGQDLIDSIDNKLFPHLGSFRQSARRAQTTKDKIGEVPYAKLYAPKRY
jgi:hypothetical protein